MPKLDEAKEKLGLLKFWLGIFVASFIGIGGWCATNYKLFNDAYLLFIGGAFLEIVLIFLIYKLNKSTKEILKEIRNLKK